MAGPKPSGHIGWVPDENAAKAQEPSNPKKALGFVGDERPDFKHHNWLWARIHNWLVYLEDVTDELVTSVAGLIAGLVRQEERQEVPAGDVDGVNDSFELSEVPADSNSIKFFIDGAIIPKTGWARSGTTIILDADYIPALGQDVYVTYGTEIAVTVGGPGGGSLGVPAVEYIVLTPTDITNKNVALDDVPLYPTQVIVDLAETGPQMYTDDFIVVGNVLSWNGRGLEAILISGDKLRVQYNV